ncbi:class I SAM-dependent methyltransferase [Nonomuraea sp. KC401]|uniref:class I SAM-dependent methyltransferase n=1 Tax=unclassified Nonomuraea TaxID=2593643 RepID=UPI0010FD46DA|nr:MULTISPECIES: class I SAM-dependent methyltransferase [unclassified Nonomuraea]NBE98791.1 methyltransferase domain-containing protein [Nonomuraea sp. K271]TLF68667.1 class I SAM-dependent methyltransferase [Nonomuraea sp. KC401]
MPMDLDHELLDYEDPLRTAAAPAPGERILDVGCGTGATSRDLAPAAAPGRVLGVDISAGSLSRAERLTRDGGIENVGYLCADAQTHPWQKPAFDLVVSRFGVMFFDDPPAAFGNLRRALRPGGRLVFLAWQGRLRNEWAVLADRVFDGVFGPPDRPAPEVGPFSLADERATRRLLRAGGFARVRLHPVDRPVRYGKDLDEAVEFVSWFSSARLAELSSARREAALATLRTELDDRRDPTGEIRLGARAWLVTAENPASTRESAVGRRGDEQ